MVVDIYVAGDLPTAMDTSNWRPNQGGTGGGDSSMESVDWRTQLPADTRHKIVNKILDNLKKHLAFSGQEKLHEIKNIALRFEEKIYHGATSHSDYMRKISIKLLAMENRAANPIANSLQSNSAGNSANPSDPEKENIPLISGSLEGANQTAKEMRLPEVTSIRKFYEIFVISPLSNMDIIVSHSSQGMQQVNNQGQSLNHPQAGQQILPPSIHNNIASSGGQGSAGISSALQPGSSLSQSTMPIISGQNSGLQNIQNISRVQPNSVGNTQPVMQHHQQTVLRQQRQQQQASIVHQQQVLSTQQQQQQPNTMGQQTSAINLQHNQLIGQQSSYSEMQQQQQSRLLGQQSNISNVQKLQHHSIGQHNNFSAVHQQQLGPQSSSTGQQQQQHQLFGTQSGSTTMVNNQHSAHLLQSKVSIPQQNQPTQGQRSQPELQQQVMPQLQTQSGQLQHQLNTKLQPNLSQWDMQQRLPTSGAFQQQNVIDQQKQLFQQQRAMPEASSTSSDSTAQTGNPNGGDWQEEVYQKINTFTVSSSGICNEEMGTGVLEKAFLPGKLKAMKDKYMPELNDMYQKIIGKLQQHDSLPQQPKGEQVEKLKMIKHVLERCMAFVQVPKSNITPNYKEKLGIYEKQIVNIISTHKRKPGVPPQQAQPLPPPHIHLTQENQMNPQMQSMNLQNNMGSLQHNSVLPSNAQQNMMSATQPTSNLDPGQNSTMNSLNINPLSSQGGMGMLQPNSSILQHQQLKQLPYRQMQQQYLHKQQLIQQQHQFQRQTKQQQQNGQLHMNQLPQLQPINDGNELKLRQQIGVKPEPLQQQQVASQRPAYHQQLKSGAPFSPQLLSASSPLTPQHSSPQIDQQNLLNSLTKSGTPLQSANSPFIVSSPSTTSTSHMPGESEKVNSGVSSLSNAGNIGHQPTGAVLPTQSLAIGTPGISASPLLAEFTSPDGNHGNGASVVSTKSSAIEQPIEHLLKVVKSISPKSLSASVSDIGSVVSMIDRIAGSAPGNGSRAAVGEDLVAMTKLHLQARTSGTPNGTRKMKRFTSAIPLNGVSSANSRRHPLLEEIRDINLGLIDTVVDISKEDADSAEGGKGTIVKCSFIASPIQPLRLLVPANYPNCSPILLDNKEYEDLSVKAQWRFGSCVRQLSEPMSLEEMVRTWDVCARTVISEYAQQSDGGTFSTKYGAWEDCLTLTGTAA
ncbi:Coactivator CBP, KIX domain-containing protein [Cynara cardunculus var. scolymus]|uniref:Coactivator CBP, KIX domain-containing protein n=1 Tax=Cynara cardunculus var. scolymus TaxID=59895 RepID=A0A103XFJ9_CYNCS|nr:Coactivator CBP, KIX domain-containing protein [Cynara cardunculus var. scolymus]